MKTPEESELLPPYGKVAPLPIDDKEERNFTIRSLTVSLGLSLTMVVGASAYNYQVGKKNAEIEAGNDTILAAEKAAQSLCDGTTVSYEKEGAAGPFKMLNTYTGRREGNMYRTEHVQAVNLSEPCDMDSEKVPRSFADFLILPKRKGFSTDLRYIKSVVNNERYKPELPENYELNRRCTVPFEITGNAPSVAVTYSSSNQNGLPIAVMSYSVWDGEVGEGFLKDLSRLDNSGVEFKVWNGEELEVKRESEDPADYDGGMPAAEFIDRCDF